MRLVSSVSPRIQTGPGGATRTRAGIKGHAADRATSSAVAPHVEGRGTSPASAVARLARLAGLDPGRQLRQRVRSDWNGRSGVSPPIRRPPPPPLRPLSSCRRQRRLARARPSPARQAPRQCNRFAGPALQCRKLFSWEHETVCVGSGKSEHFRVPTALNAFAAGDGLRCQIQVCLIAAMVVVSLVIDSSEA
jgi:hypothetical protein